MASGLSRLLAGTVVTIMAAGFAVTSLAGIAAAAGSDSRPPLAPANLTVNGKACGGNPLLLGNYRTYTLAATATDADNDRVGTEFDWWPVSHPDQVTVRQSAGPLSSGQAAGVNLDRSELTDGVAYAWRARTSDGQATGPWSGVCEFTTDQAGPNAPTVSSADYPSDAHFHGGSGIPGTFTFNANGSSDVVGFRYGLNEPTTSVTADQPGGSATIQITPATVGPFTLSVLSVDAAGNFSQTTRYSFAVTDNSPIVSCTPATGYRNTPRACSVSPHNGANVGYVYQVDNGSKIDLAAGPDGTATFTTTPGTDTSTVNVQARLTNGNLTAARTVTLFVDPGAPTITTSSDEVLLGQTVEFTFQAVLPGSTTFTYTWEGGAPVTLPVGTDGTATVSLIADQLGFPELDLYSTAADGFQSATAEAAILVDNGPPTVSSTDYPRNQFAGGVGVAGTFTFSTAAPNVVSYTYRFNSGDPVTVPAVADGTATVSITPTTPDGQTIFVTANLADGSQTDLTRYGFYVKE